jgi:hypothetical protein
MNLAKPRENLTAKQRMGFQEAELSAGLHESPSASPPQYMTIEAFPIQHSSTQHRPQNSRLPERMEPSFGDEDLHCSSLRG